MSDNLLDVIMPPKEEIIIEERADELAEQEQVVEKEVVEDDEPPPLEFIPDEEVFNPPKIAKVKRKCSEKQLKHLETIRKKALAKKQENKRFLEEQRAKQERYRNQDQRSPLQSHPRKKVIKKKVYIAPEPEEEIEYIYEEQPRGPQNYEEPEPTFNLTPAMLKQLQRDAISEYDNIRQQRVQHARLQQQQQHVEDERRKIMKQMGQPDQDPWSECFQ